MGNISPIYSPASLGTAEQKARKPQIPPRYYASQTIHFPFPESETPTGLWLCFRVSQLGAARTVSSFLVARERTAPCLLGDQARYNLLAKLTFRQPKASTKVRNCRASSDLLVVVLLLLICQSQRYLSLLSTHISVRTCHHGERNPRQASRRVNGR